MPEHESTYTESTDGTKGDLDEARPIANIHYTNMQSDGLILGTPVRRRPLTYPREAIYGAVALITAVLFMPQRYLIATFYDHEQKFSILNPIFYLRRSRSSANQSKKARGPQDSVAAAQGSKSDRLQASDERTTKPLASGSLPEDGSTHMIGQGTSQLLPQTRTTDSTSQTKTSKSKTVSSEGQSNLRTPVQKTSRGLFVAAETFKSPPRSPAFAIPAHQSSIVHQSPRPLVPKRQASNSGLTMWPSSRCITLVVDLDETLIHSMAKGGRMSTGHMVEVKLFNPAGAGGTSVAAQVPILYYVHKRPYCDEFLRKVSKWYNLVVFTASVQEYADPVIDWLELERKYFTARYYRQHCTYRNGSYIKDISQIESDLRRVVILDNSPVSYILHEGNAVPIEGWISDPTDGDLLHLIPLLEGLQHATDVRALLSLRFGESVHGRPNHDNVVKT